MTRAVVATAFGGPEVLAVIQTPTGSPGPGEALVSVRAAGRAGLEERVRALAPGGVDAAVDCAGGDEALDTSLALVASRGEIVTVVASRRAFDSGIKVIGAAPGADPGTEIRAAARLSLARLAEAGKLRVVVAAAYPLAETAAAHRALATGHTRGKIVLVP